jgi:hypothetical protein
MSSDQRGPEETFVDSAPAEETPTEETAAEETPAEATKRKFREALAAKQRRHGEDHIDTDPQRPSAHGPVETKRTFRRKTG